MSVARVPFLLGLSLVAVYAGGGAARAADGSGRQLTGQWAFCGAPLTPPPAGDPATREAPDTATTIDAGSVRYDAATGRYTFLGRPVLSRADQRLEADRLEYDEGRQRAEASGGFRYDEAGVVMKGDRGTYDLDDNTGQFSQVSYRVEAGHLHGEADSVDVESESRTRYRNVTLTTCNPGEEDWWLHAGEVTIDTQEREGVAYNAWLSFWHVPLFYTPYISFPVGSGRKTGFLAPNIGNSDTGGASLSTPYYLNLAPNYDDTITPTVYARRGLMLSNEFRYLTRSLSGEIRGSYLPDDQAYGEDRWSIMQRHRLALGQHFRGELLQQRVSDT
ncbi:MAG: putative LPS assembly protein LptD, partial [Ectothiorhodospiraceae bacterium]